jgi:hypothetical protein
MRAFGDPLALMMPDPDHSEGEERDATVDYGNWVPAG